MSSHIGSNNNFVTAQKNWFLVQNIHLLDPKGLIWDHLGPNMANNWFADQLIGSVGLGARAVSRKTPIYFTFYYFLSYSSAFYVFFILFLYFKFSTLCPLIWCTIKICIYILQLCTLYLSVRESKSISIFVYCYSEFRISPHQANNNTLYLYRVTPKKWYIAFVAKRCCRSSI